MKNISWNNIEPGQIVSFIYKSKNETRAVKRFVLCINPELRYRKKNGRTTKFFVGIQLDTDKSKPMSSSQIKNLIGKLGGLKKEGDVISADLSEDMTKIETSTILSQIRSLSDFFRTYNLRECKRRRVFLEDNYSRIPQTSVDLIIKTNDYQKKVLGLDEN